MERMWIKFYLEDYRSSWYLIDVYLFSNHPTVPTISMILMECFYMISVVYRPILLIYYHQKLSNVWIYIILSFPTHKCILPPILHFVLAFDRWAGFFRIYSESINRFHHKKRREKLKRQKRREKLIPFFLSMSTHMFGLGWLISIGQLAGPSIYL